MSSERIRIRMEAYDHRVLDRSALEIIETAKRTDAKVFGQHEDNFLVPYAAKSDNYDIAERKVDIETVYFVTDLKVKIV